MDENYLIDKLRLKEEAAFGAFIEKYQKLVLNICYKFVHSRDDAEDVAQEVFIEVFLSVGQFKGDSKITTWLYRIAVNKSLDFLKKQKRKKRFGSVVSIFGLNLENEQSAKTTSTPLSLLELSDKKKTIYSALDKLPDNQKAAITLAKLEGLSYAEIAEILKTSSSAVDSLIQRAKNNLKKYLSTEDF